MNDLGDRIRALDMAAVEAALDRDGYALVPGLLRPGECRELAGTFDWEEGFRKQVLMERYRYGRGLYKYWDYPLPPPIQQLREALYPRLVPIANRWMERLRLERRFPATLAGLSRACRDRGQCRPTPLILKYGAGGFNTLHQDIYGEVYFPLQAALFLSEPGADYSGGEFLLSEQAARAQAKVSVLRPGRGDMLVFATRFRPAQGRRGHARVAMKHGVAEVHSGARYAAGVIFHDAVH